MHGPPAGCAPDAPQAASPAGCVPSSSVKADEEEEVGNVSESAQVLTATAGCPHRATRGSGTGSVSRGRQRRRRPGGRRPPSRPGTAAGPGGGHDARAGASWVLCWRHFLTAPPLWLVLPQKVRSRQGHPQETRARPQERRGGRPGSPLPREHTGPGPVCVAPVHCISHGPHLGGVVHGPSGDSHRCSPHGQAARHASNDAAWGWALL